MTQAQDLPKGEARWPGALAIVCALVLYVALPPQFTLLPWLLPFLEISLLLPLMITKPYRDSRESLLVQSLSIFIIALINIANFISLILLAHFLVAGAQINGQDLLLDGVNIWLTNIIVFGLWYWELDRGGPAKNRSYPPDFLFPQMGLPQMFEQWTPHFVDYFYCAFTNATAFSPTDTMPLSPKAKTLMLIQSLTSFITVALIVSRAVNILS